MPGVRSLRGHPSTALQPPQVPSAFYCLSGSFSTLISGMLLNLPPSQNICSLFPGDLKQFVVATLHQIAICLISPLSLFWLLFSGLTLSCGCSFPRTACLWKVLSGHDVCGVLTLIHPSVWLLLLFRGFQRNWSCTFL